MSLMRHSFKEGALLIPSTTNMKVIDSHIHLLSLKNQSILKWHGDHPLNVNCRLEEYTSQSNNKDFDIDGVVVVEFDPVVDLEKGLDGCQSSILEYQYISRIINGTLPADEGSNDYSNMIKAYIPWAPMPLGPKVLEQFVNIMKDSGNNFDYVKGFRYLLQDKPKQVMLQPDFIESMKWLDNKNFVFDWGIDLRSGGLWQFEESVELFKQVPNVKYIINHLTKPSYGNLEQFDAWKQLMEQMYKLTPNSYMKLSGGFSEVPKEITDDLDECIKLIFPWFKVCFDLWGVDRTIWASNWPPCTIAAGSNLVPKWYKITEKLFDLIDLAENDRHKIYYQNYKLAYNI